MEPNDFWQFQPHDDPFRAAITIDSTKRWPHRISPLLYGKFCEHLFFNIYHGMDAQILLNPTFGKWRFNCGEDEIDGGAHLHTRTETVRKLGRGLLRTRRLPDMPQLLSDFEEGAAFGWFRLGVDRDARGEDDEGTGGKIPGEVSNERVTLSPDVGPHGGRAQRMEIGKSASDKPGELAGIAQWTHLPLHRTRTYEYRIVARAAEAVAVTFAIAPIGAADISAAVPIVDASSTAKISVPDAPIARDSIEGAALEAAERPFGLAAARAGGPGDRTTACTQTFTLNGEWSTYTGTLQLGDDCDANAVYQISLTCDQSANIVIGRVLLYPSDHHHHADPDVIRLLRDSRLPLLRWPGGNFASGYHWRDGVGPVDERPTLTNPSWAWVEPNLFGTREFVDFCRAVGCEPMICVNAGSGTPEEAAAWVEYCNGAADTPMGRRRAAAGHPEPFGIRYWEIGNELYGRWQIGWTTPGGKVDRYLRFERAMKAADPTIETLGCGYSHWPGNKWDEAMISRTGGKMRHLTQHILPAGRIDPSTSPTDLYHACMAFPDVLAERLREMQSAMLAAGISEPHVSLTELMLWLRMAKPSGSARSRLKRRELPNYDTISEALYATGMINMSIRLSPLVALITHSATVNHGGGLKKMAERVWADPVHWAHQLGIEMAGAVPVAVSIRCAAIHTPREIMKIPPIACAPAIDAMAAVHEDSGRLTLMLVRRSGGRHSIRCDVRVAGSDAGAAFNGTAIVHTLGGKTATARNTFDQPAEVLPRQSTVPVADGRLTVTLPPFSMCRIDLPEPPIQDGPPV